MAQTETSEAAIAGVETNDLLHGAVGGLVGGIVFGVMMQMQMPMIMEGAIPGMYGLGESLAAGWILHLIHSVIFGLVYVAIARFEPIRSYATSMTSGVALGIGYGLVIWVIAASIIMPAWVGAMMPMMDPPVPDFVPESALGHAVFGLLLGAYYGYVGGE